MTAGKVRTSSPTAPGVMPHMENVAINRPRNVAGNPDSPQVVIFSTSFVDVLLGYHLAYRGLPEREK